MDIPQLDQYFELALDLPDRKRAELLDRLDRELPAMARELRRLLAAEGTNPDFACRTGVAGRPSATLDDLHHVAIQVDDIAAAVGWYRQRFGCHVEYADDSWALLRFQNIRLALQLPGSHPPHVAVIRDDAAAFGSLQPHRDATRSTYLTDPWGNTIEVLDRNSLPGE